MEDSEEQDCLIIGGGPAGLTAALYMARFRRRTRLMDAGESRASMIPITHNFPGFPDGVSGQDLLRRLRRQAEKYGARLQRGTVDSLSVVDDGFIATVGKRRIFAAKVILTTGVVDKDAGIPDVRTATLNGSLRWCPVCDGHEVMNLDVALLASAKDGPGHALFLRTYSRHVTLLLMPHDREPSTSARQDMARAGIRLIEAPVRDIEPAKTGKTLIRLHTGDEYLFDTLYPMLGHEARSQLAVGLGAECDESGDLIVDAHQQTTIPGLYAAGDLVKALNQMAVGTAHAAIAATAAHNTLKTNFR